MNNRSVLISTAVWGERYINYFIQYNLPSLIGGIGSDIVTSNYDIHFLIMTDQNGSKEISSSLNLFRKKQNVSFHLTTFSDLQLNLENPQEINVEKYSFLSILQNAAIECSKSFDAHIFNYADFVYANDFLDQCLQELFSSKIFALTTFAPPVDRDKATKILTSERLLKGNNFNSFSAAKFAIDNIEPDAALRFWENDSASHSPSYTIWRNDDNGVLIRAFHPSIVAVKPSDAPQTYYDGIFGGAMDSFFVSKVLSNTNHKHYSKFASFSLYKALSSSKIEITEREKAFKKFAEENFSKNHLILAGKPIIFPFHESHTKTSFDELAKKSKGDIDFILGNIDQYQEARDYSPNPSIPTPQHFANNKLLNSIKPREAATQTTSITTKLQNTTSIIPMVIDQLLAPNDSKFLIYQPIHPNDSRVSKALIRTYGPKKAYVDIRSSTQIQNTQDALLENQTRFFSYKTNIILSEKLIPRIPNIDEYQKFLILHDPLELLLFQYYEKSSYIKGFEPELAEKYPLIGEVTLRDFSSSLERFSSERNLHGQNEHSNPNYMAQCLLYYTGKPVDMLNNETLEESLNYFTGVGVTTNLEVIYKKLCENGLKGGSLEENCDQNILYDFYFPSWFREKFRNLLEYDYYIFNKICD